MGVNRKQFLLNEIVRVDPTKSTDDILNGDIEETYHSMLNAGTILKPSTKRTRVVYAIGDSLTAGAATGGGGIAFDSTLFSSIGQPCLQYQGGSWVTWALLASTAKWTIGGVFATGGYTAAQILNTHVPSLLATARQGDTVVVLAGTNGNILNDVKTIHTTLRAAGLNTVACTIPPSTGSTLSSVAAFNAGLKAYTALQGIPLVDTYSSVVDPATGAYLSSFYGDGVHPNQPGFQKMGQTIAAVLNSFFPTAVSLVEHNASYSGQMQANPLGLTAIVSGTDYYFNPPVGTSTAVSAANSNFTGNSGYKFTRNDTNLDGWLNYCTFTPGNKVRIGLAIETNVPAGGGFGFRFESSTTGSKTVCGIGYPGLLTTTVPPGRFYIEFTVPPLPDTSYRNRISITGAAGTFMHLGEITVQDLTVMGL